MKKEFKVFSPLTQKSVEKSITKNQEDNDDGRLLLVGIASTSNRDLHNEIVTPDAIKDMVNQAESLNIHADHFYGISDVIGAIQKATLTEDESLQVKFLITKKYTPVIKDLLDTGVKLGLSIGGYVEDYDEKNQLIKQIRLHEISLTAMPANWDTFGTVTTTKGVVESNCITGACYELIKGETMEEHTIEKEAQDAEVQNLTEEKVIELINEYMTEKEETIAQEITEKVESQLEALVEAKVKELIDEPKEEDEAEPPADDEAAEKAEEEPAEPEDEDEEEEPKEEASKNIDIDITEVLAESIDKALGEDFADKVASKMFGKLDANRTTTGSKFEQYTKSINTEEPQEPVVEKSTYSTTEASKILIAKQQKANPIMAAALKQLK